MEIKDSGQERTQVTWADLGPAAQPAHPLALRIRGPHATGAFPTGHRGTRGGQQATLGAPGLLPCPAPRRSWRLLQRLHPARCHLDSGLSRASNSSPHPRCPFLQGLGSILARHSSLGGWGAFQVSPSLLSARLSGLCHCRHCCLWGPALSTLHGTAVPSPPGIRAHYSSSADPTRVCGEGWQVGNGPGSGVGRQ